MTLTIHTPIVFIPTNAPEVARAFYENTLGLNFVSSDNFATVFRVGPTQTMLRLTCTGDFTPNPFTIFGWESPDIEADVKALTTRGVSFLLFPHIEQDKLGIWTAPNGNKVAWFKDPDGNTLSISNHA